MLNKNFPKCRNCLELDCHAGEVNHEVINDHRADCIYGCGCKAFQPIGKNQYIALQEAVTRQASGGAE